MIYYTRILRAWCVKCNKETCHMEGKDEKGTLWLACQKSDCDNERPVGRREDATPRVHSERGR